MFFTPGIDARAVIIRITGWVMAVDFRGHPMFPTGFNSNRAEAAT
jgi:hypothetical protein